MQRTNENGAVVQADGKEGTRGVEGNRARRAGKALDLDAAATGHVPQADCRVASGRRKHARLARMRSDRSEVRRRMGLDENLGETRRWVSDQQSVARASLRCIPGTGRPSAS